MGGKTSSPQLAKPLIPPDESVWEKYSPHFELPLASATSVCLHGTIIGILAIAGMTFFWSASHEATKPAKMDLVMIDGDGSGVEGLGGEPGLPGAPGAADKKTEFINPDNNPDQPERNPARPAKDSPLELGLALIDDGKAPLNDDLSIELAKLAKEADEAAKKEPPTPAVKADTKKPGLVGTGKPRGKGGLGGSGDGPGLGTKKGAGLGAGGPGGRKATKQEIYAWRWNFDLGGDGREHARKLAAIGVTVAVQDPKGQVYFITDLNRRPAELKKGTLPNLKEVVGWKNQKQESIQALARELRLPFMPTYVLLLLPQEREEKMAAEEARFAGEQRRELRTVQKTWFDFRLRKGTYDPVGIRLE